MAEKENEVSGLLIILSILFAIVGYIAYFIKKDDNPYAAKIYLSCAIASSILGILLII